MFRIDSIEVLLEELKNINFLNDKLDIINNIINIHFHSEFILTIEFKGDFLLYFNDVYYYDVEDQDILETIIDLATNDYIFIEKKKLLRGKKVLVLPASKYDEIIKDFPRRKVLKIYSKEKLFFRK